MEESETPRGHGAITESDEASLPSTPAEAVEELLWQLIRGDIEFQHVPAGLSAWYMAGANVHGSTCCQAEIEHLERLVDYWYFRACNPGKTGADYYSAITNRLWEEANQTQDYTTWLAEVSA